LKDGIRLPDRKAAAQAAIRYVQLVYGSQLQRPADEETVDPRSRRRGCGMALLRTLCEWFAEREVVGVTVGVDSSNPNALAFWKKLSFQEFHRELTTPLDSFKERL
jgi:GNAT superfamily N-acetyltransferase